MPKASKYKPEFCDMLLDHMDSGLDYGSFAGVVGVKRSTLYDWEKNHEEWAEARELGEGLLYLYNMRLGRDATIGKVRNFNNTVWIFIMKNCHGWRDKQKDEVDVIVKNEVTISPTDVKERIKQIKERKS